MRYEAESGEFNMALAGDVILTRRLSIFREEAFLKLRDIFRAADASFANFESSAHEYLDGPHNISEGTYPTTEPALLEDLKWMGIGLVSSGNSHSFDYGEAGILRTNDYLKKAGIVHAGIGRNLREARSPAYLDTPRGRVGLIGVTAHYKTWTIAGEQREDTIGRPGVNPLRYKTNYVITKEAMEHLRRLGTNIGLDAARERKRNLGNPMPPESPDRYEFLGHNFVLGNDFEVRTSPHEQDLKANLKQVREARQMADRVLVSLHYHEPAGPNLFTATRRSLLDEPAEFVKEFGRRCIEEGADIVACHGPQIPMGIEIHEGRPLFYSLGALAFELETVRFLPEEAYRRYGLDGESTPSDFIRARYQNDTKGHPSDPLQWEQVVAVCSFESDRLAGIDLYPLDLGFGRPRYQRGRPLLADEELGRKIIDRVAGLSARVGTEIAFREGRGVVSMA